VPDFTATRVGRDFAGIYAIETVDQAISLLTGLPAGERDAAGKLPAGGINRKVAERLS